jgi:hypothetical protein
MRYIPILLLLASCQTWGWSDTADVLMPDEFTLGSGSVDSSLSGATNPWHDQQGDEWPIDMDGESESTYAALTWDLPSFKSDNGMSRETQRNLALLVDHMVAEEGLVATTDEVEEVSEQATVGPLKLNLREGVSLPSKELFFSVLGALLLVLVFVRYKANASKRRWQ